MQDENKTTNLALYDTTKVGKPRDKIPIFFLLIVVLLLSNIATGAWVKQSLRQFTVQSYKLQQSQADLTERTIERDTNDTSLRVAYAEIEDWKAGRRHTLHEAQLEAKSILLEMREKQASKAVAPEASTDESPLLSRRPSYSSPQVSEEVIESTIKNDFNGWDGETVFALDNGQIWQQAEYDYTYHYAFRPDVTIYSTSEGYRMKVEDLDETILVNRIR